MKNAFKNSNFSKLTHVLRITLCALLVAMLIVPFVLDNSRNAQLLADITDSESIAEASIINYAGQTSASNTSSAVVNVDGKDITIYLNQSLTKNGDSYELKLTPQASFSHIAYSDDSNVAKCGYFEAPANGTYVFEVWGGDGGIGENTNKSNGGQGGKGGYLNAELTMTAGDIIFYTIGGDGQATASPTYGGGANGDGGDHGETGRYMVGGGGGFTAVYYFSKGTQANAFKSKYMSGSTLTSSNLDESDRTSKYIMIAGGGGGGGAGNSVSGAVRTPDGGNAGNMTSPSGKITSAAVTGTYYAGANGKSSGDSQDYVGVGGSNVPGEEKSTKYDWFTGKTANNWEGTANTEVAAGTGGAGNLRGGAGGAGFCGGSGGIMRSLVIGSNVGGGGGGSSFIADTVSPVTNTSYLTNNNTSKTGGAVSITYVPTANELNTVQNLKLEGKISSYFTVTSITTSDSSTVTSGTLNSFVVTGVNALYKDESNKETTITLVLEPTTSTSMGGNDVPIYATDSNKITFTKSDSTTYTINTSDDCSYVNIPYKYTGITTNTITGKTAAASALFVDAGYSTTAFITFSGYSVTDNVTTYSGSTLSTTLAPESTTIYTISYTVTPKKTSDIKAVIGDILKEKKFTATNTITNEKLDGYDVNGNAVKYTKSISYSGGTYYYNVDVTSTVTKPTTNAYAYSNSGSTSITNVGTTSYSAPYTGYYLIQAWGAKGARGQDCKRSFLGNEYSGGEGANGGYVYSVIYLKKGETIDAIVGSAPTQATATVGDDDYYNVGGGGGGYSAVRITSGDQTGQVVLVAAGGGGGGGAAKWGGSKGYDGAKASNNPTVTNTTSITLSNDYNGTNGGPAIENVGGGSAGTSPASAKNTSVDKNGYTGITFDASSEINKAAGISIIDVSVTDGGKGIDTTDSSTITAASVVITPLDVETTTLHVYGNYSLSFNFTNNFVVGTPTYSGIDSKTVTTPTAANGNTLTISSISPTGTGDYNYSTTTSKDLAFSITVPLTAKTDFPGGNDILLAEVVTLSQTDSDSNTSNDSINLAANEKVDYVNVAINETLVVTTETQLKDYKINGNTINYIVGSGSINKADLYSTTPSYSFNNDDALEYYIDEGTLAAENATFSPTSNKSYTITYGIKAKTGSTKADKNVVAEVTNIHKKATAEINAYYKVEYNLIEVTHNATTVAPVGSDYSVTLTPVSGKVVKLGAIKIGDTEYEDYTSSLDKDTGILTLTIPSAAITDTISISADARNKETLYSIYYAYATDLDGNEKVKTEVGIKAGTDITSTVASIVDIGTPTSITGYKYVIEYPTGEVLDYKSTSTKFTTMPAENCWIFAYYTPIEYTLTINYENTSEPSVSTKCFYGTEFSYASPNVSSMAPKKIKVNDAEVTTYGTPALVCGTMPNNNLTIDVEYESIGPNDVIVTINYADDPTKTNQQTITKDGDGEITVKFDSATGYDITTSATGLTSNTPYTTSEAYITITYTPHQSSITFNSGSGASAVADRAAFYGQSYGYTLVDGKTGFNNISFEPFPVPIKNGWVFDGWYIDNTQILESTLFNGTSDVTLTANWIPYELSKAYVTIKPIDDQTYTGNALKPTVKLVWNTENITWKAANTEISSTHYSVEYEKNVNVLDTPVITIKFNGFKYSGTFKTTFNIKQASNDITKLTLDGWTFGTPNSPSVTAEFGADTVTYQYSDNESSGYSDTKPTDVGTYYVKATIPATTNYASATKTESFTISAKNSSNITVELTPKDGFPYDGSEHEFEDGNIVVKDGDTPLTEGTDYEIEYDNKTNPPKGKFTIKFKGNYKTTPNKVVEYPINPADLTSDGNLKITLDPDSYIYTGSKCEPKVSITHTTFTITSSDYDVTYEDNINPGTAKAIITFKGDSFKGTVVERFTITTLDLSSDSNIEITLGTYNDIYSGTAKTPSVTIKHKTNSEIGTLTDSDYSLTYKDNTNAGTATVIINYKGRFYGSVDKTFAINPLNLTNSSKVHVTLSQSSYVYTGSECEPTIKSITHDDGLTIKSTEYSITGYSNNINVGTNALVNISYSGNYTGTATKDFAITQASNAITSLTLDDWTFGSPNSPSVTATFGADTATYQYSKNESSGYSVTKPTDVGTYYVKATIPATTNYASATKTESFTISAKNSSNITVELTPKDGFPYDGSEHEFEDGNIVVKDGDTILTKGKDYDIEYDNKTNPPKGKFTIKFKGNYDPTPNKPVEYPINPADLTSDGKLNITVTPTTFEYSGKQCKPTVTIEHDTFGTLVEGTDFYVTYLNNIEPGTNTASATITYTGKYTGSTTEYFTINKADMSSDGNLSISLSQTEYTYSGKENKPTATVTHTTFGTLTLTTDYTVSYSENTDAGQATITINFTGTHFEGSKVENFTINPLDLTNSSKVHVTLSQSSYVYTGSDCEPTISTITHDDGLTIKSTEYSITGYSNNINVGTNALVNISYSGNYTGTATAAFAITQASNAITKLTLSDWTFGSPNSPSVTATFGASTVTYQYSDNESSGYSYIKPTDVGTYYVKATISETSNYASATKTESFKITSKAITPTIIITPEEETFNGDEIEPTVIVKDENGKPLEEGKDYIIKYDDNTTTPKGKIKVEFIGNYDDTPDKEKEFTIKSKAPTDSETAITLSQYTYTYSGNANEPTVTIFITGIGDLVEGTDFDVTYSNNINAGTATANIAYKGNYSGTTYKNFTINKKQPTILKPITWDYDGTETYVYDGTEKSVALENIPDGYTPIYFNEAHTKAGTYKTKVDFSYDEENFEPITVNPITWTIEKANYDMSNAKWDYESAFTYDGSQKKVQVIGLPQGVTVVKYSNEAKTVAGTYKAVAVLDYDVDNYNAPSIDDLTWTINQKDINPSKTDETGTATIETEDGIPVDVELVVELKASAEGKETESGNKLKLENELGFGEAFGEVYEIKIMRDGQEIQPEDIAPGTVLKLKMKVPENLVGKNFRIIHIHNNDDISYITKGNAADIGTYIIDEEGYIVTMVNKFSEFTFVYNIKCISHWFLLAFLLLFIAFVAVYLTVLVKKIQKEKTKILVPVIVCAVFALATIITALLGTCYYCIIMTIINGVTLLIALLIFGFFFFKKRQLVGKVEAVQDTQNAAPAQQPEELLELIKKVAEKVLVDSGKEVKEEHEEAAQEESNTEEVKEESQEQLNEKAKEEVIEETAPLALKDSIALAKANTGSSQECIDPSKAAVCKYLSKYEDVELNTRANYTATGLPLADTHYQIKDGNRVCFTYVYEFEDGKALYLIRTDKDTAKKLQDKHPSITSSAFPKSPANDWYTVVIDDSFKSNDDIHEVFDLALGKETEIITTTDFIKEDEPLSLKDSIALAKTNVQVEKEALNINKKVVCDYLAANYKDSVEINTRVNYTVTGLPLADTHYDLRLEKKVCFTYVYELEDGKVFFLIRAKKEVAEDIKKLHPALTSSAFPKSPANDWYTLILDDTFETNNDVFDVIDMILGKVKESDGLSLKDSIKLAKEDVSAPKEELNISKKAIVDYLAKYEDVEINTRGNYTVTGLPLADTHYQIKDGNRVCFTYVYELENGKVFLLIRSSKDVAAKIKAKHSALASSAFPKAPNKDWYTLIIDNTFSSNIDVYDVLDMVLGKGEETEALSLKESLALAKENATAPKEELNPSKAAICKYLSTNYKDSVEINTRGNYTVTGLPLADTHYQIKDGNRVCFTYVYELENGNTLLLVKADKDAIGKIKAKHSSVKSSAFPKCPTKDWYTVVIDDSFKSNDDIYEILDIVLSTSKVAEPAKEEVKEAVSLKESIELAKKEDNTQSKVDISKKVIKEYLDNNYQGIVEANSRVNYTKTGLPLADTYYDIKSAKKVCFAYCYELEDGKTFFLIRANEETINKIMEKHPGIKSSAFPKEPADSWYTMVIDDSFKSNEDVYEVLDILISAKKFEKSLIEQLIDSIE